jgi:hypothetical protein
MQGTKVSENNYTLASNKVSCMQSMQNKLRENVYSAKYTQQYVLCKRIHCNEDVIYKFLSGNSAAPVPISTFKSVSDLYIPRSTYFLKKNRQVDRGNI